MQDTLLTRRRQTHPLYDTLTREDVGCVVDRVAICKSTHTQSDRDRVQPSCASLYAPQSSVQFIC